MRYKVGDKVKIKEDLRTYELYGEYEAVGKMLEFCGKEVKIQQVYQTHYDITEDNGRWAWTDEMFEDASTKDTNTIQIRYIDPNITKLEKIDKGDLVDLRVSKVKKNGEDATFPCEYKFGDTLFFKLGFAMKLPKGHKANVYPRSGMFKNYGFLLTNSVGQIDNTYNGNDDEWGAMVWCTRDGVVNYDDRILQFDISKTTMDNIIFEEVEQLENTNRGGYSSTGVK